MNILTLSKEQEVKLLELCKAFFPKYKHIYFELPINNGGMGEEYVCFVKNQEGTIIHWYQLCLTELPLKMFNGKRKFLELSDWQQFRLSQTHPVDYLYQFWQENK